MNRFARETFKMRFRMTVAFVVVAVASLAAQTFRGTILGTVTDPTGAVVAGAQVKVRNAGTGLERTAVTSGDGSYAVSELPIGSYDVTVTQTGFQTFVAKAVTVDVATERRVDAALKAGEVSTRVEVQGDLLPQVETTSATLGGTLSADAITNIPVNGRDYTKLVYLNPGVAGSPDQISDSAGSFGTFSMNGSRGDQLGGCVWRSGNDFADRRGGRVARAIERRSRVRSKQRGHRQYCDQERNEQLARILAGILAQRAVGCA